MGAVHEITQAISLGMTPAAIVMATLVVCYWWDGFKRALKKPRSEREAFDWFIIGVAVSFIGSIIDNAYWGLAWGAYFIGSNWADVLFSSGVYFNVFDRQLASIIAAYCHVRAALMHGVPGTKTKADKWLYATGVFGFAFVVALYTIKALSFSG